MFVYIGAGRSSMETSMYKYDYSGGPPHPVIVPTRKIRTGSGSSYYFRITPLLPGGGGVLLNINKYMTLSLKIAQQLFIVWSLGPKAFHNESEEPGVILYPKPQTLHIYIYIYIYIKNIYLHIYVFTIVTIVTIIIIIIIIIIIFYYSYY